MKKTHGKLKDEHGHHRKHGINSGEKDGTKIVSKPRIIQ
jgi:hypothetical protein